MFPSRRQSALRKSRHLHKMHRMEFGNLRSLRETKNMDDYAACNGSSVHK